MATSRQSVEQFTMFIFFGFLLLVCLISLLLSINRNPSQFFSQQGYITQRIADMNNIRRDIQTYYQSHYTLPTYLDQMPQKKYFFDPQTGSEYIYYTTSTTDYTLCYYQVTRSHDDSLFDILLPVSHVFDEEETSQQCSSYNVVQPVS